MSIIQTLLFKVPTNANKFGMPWIQKRGDKN